MAPSDRRRPPRSPIDRSEQQAMIRSNFPDPLTRAMNLVRDLFSLSTPQFVLFMLGISMLVISTVHMPRREHSDRLESRLNSLKGQEKVLSQRLSESYAQLGALEKDRFYRREALRKLTGQNLTGERTLSDHLEQSGQSAGYLRDSR